MSRILLGQHCTSVIFACDDLSSAYIYVFDLYRTAVLTRHLHLTLKWYMHLPIATNTNSCSILFLTCLKKVTVSFNGTFITWALNSYSFCFLWIFLLNGSVHTLAVFFMFFIIFCTTTSYYLALKCFRNPRKREKSEVYKALVGETFRWTCCSRSALLHGGHVARKEHRNFIVWEHQHGHRDVM